MLEYTTLQLVPVVLFSCHDVLLHTTSLLLVCSSLIHHSQKYTRWQLYYIDRIFCFLYALVCFVRSYQYKLWVHALVLMYQITVFYGVMHVYGWNQYLHVTIHTTGAIVGLRCIEYYRPNKCPNLS